jgi:hypothetical protein
MLTTLQPQLASGQLRLFDTRTALRLVEKIGNKT